MANTVLTYPLLDVVVVVNNVRVPKLAKSTVGFLRGVRTCADYVGTTAYNS